MYHRHKLLHIISIVYVSTIRPSLGKLQTFQSNWNIRFDPGSGQVGFVVDKVALGQVFSEYFDFPYQSSFHQLLHNQPHLIWGWYNRPEVAAVQGT
jgi:hypothetical protein